MHQQFRHPPRGISPATSPQTNPTRTNNPRDAHDASTGSRSRAASETAYPGSPIEAISGDATAGASAAAAATASSASLSTARPSRESIKKLDQIIQNFYLKAAVLIVQSRIPVTLSDGGRGKRTNKWFQIETEDIDDFRDELKIWKHCGSFDNRPPPMVIETYLDASRLASGQTLVIVDENGKPCDALESLNTSDLSASGSDESSSNSGRSDNNGSNNNKIRTRSTEIILERWKVELQCIPSLLKSHSGGSDGSGGSAGDDVAGGKGGLGDKGRTNEAASPGVEMEMDDFGPILPTIYKRSIVFFRSLFVTTNVLPAYRFSRQATKKGVHPALQVRCRVLTGIEAEARISANGFDILRQPLFYDGGRDAVTDYMFGDLEVPIGRFSASVTYRNSCSFSIVDSELLSSSRFMVVDENYFRPSLATAQRADGDYFPQQQLPSQQQQQQQSQYHNQRQQYQPGQQHRQRDSSVEVVGSLPQHLRHDHRAAEAYRPQPQQTYGSLSTFHGAGALGTSPLTALKAVRPAGSESSSPSDSIRPSSMDQHRPQLEPPNSLPIGAGRHPSAPFSSLSPASSISARPPTLRNLDGIGRRSSVSFNPFKAGSLSGSPRVSQDEIMQIPSSPLSGSRPTTSGISALAQARNRSSLTAGMAASLRGAPSISTSVGSPSAAAAAMMVMDPGAGSSPRPSAGSRYSSSFTHRRGRSSFGGASRGEDDQGSSGKQSLASSMAQPGSGLLAEVVGVGSSGSLQADDDNLSEFLKTLESKKTLQSFEISSRRGESARRTVAQLSRYQLMRDSNVALTESMNSSMQLPSRSLSSSIRHPAGTMSGLSGSLGAAGGGGAAVNSSPSMSPSISPKPLSPHTPHTPHMPAVPSRLSKNIMADYQGSAHAHARPGNQRQVSTPEEEEDADADEERARKSEGGATAIDIPVSPRPLLQDGSSAATKKRTIIADDGSADLAAFGSRQRSLSATAEDREPPSPGALFRLEGEDPESGGSGEASASASAIGRAGGAAGILRPSSGGALRRRSGGAGGGTRPAPSSMPSALNAAATALRSVTASGPASGTSQRRRYTSRLQSQQSQQQQQQADSPGSRESGSEGRPTTPRMSRGSIPGSFTRRYSGGSDRGSGRRRDSGSGGGDGEADEEILVFDLSEFGA